VPAISTTAAFMDRGSDCYDTLHPYATQTIRIHAHRLARATVIPGMSAADYEQQLALDLWQRLPAYKPERAGLATFIDRTVRHRVCSFFTAAKAAAHCGERQGISLDSEEEGRRLATRLSTAEGLWERAGELEHEVGLRHDLARFVASLPPALERCLAILTSGSIGVAVRREKLHRSSYYEALDRLRRSARQAGLHDYLSDPDKSKNGSVSKYRERRARV
jgi:hypothetical protein